MLTGNYVFLEKKKLVVTRKSSRLLKYMVAIETINCGWSTQKLLFFGKFAMDFGVAMVGGLVVIIL